MGVRIIEQTTVGKLGAERCEDFVHVSDGYVAVIDGASSILPNFSGKKPGRIIAELIDLAMAEIEPRLSANAFFSDLCRRVSSALDAAWPSSAAERPTASVLVYSVARAEVWALGDGWVKVGESAHELKISYAEAYTFLRCAYLNLLLAEGHSVEQLMNDPSALDLVRPFIQLQSRIQNRLASPYGYGVFDGSLACLDFLKIIQVDPGQDVVLASDGYPVLGDDLAATEKILNDCLMADPLMIDRYPQIKGLMKGQVSFDDRAYVRFRSGN